MASHDPLSPLKAFSNDGFHTLQLDFIYYFQVYQKVSNMIVIKRCIVGGQIKVNLSVQILVSSIFL